MSRLNVANFRHPDGTDDNLNLDSSGRVGIGTASPSVPLQVNGTGQIARFESSSSSAVVRIANTETNPCEFVYTSDLAINVGGSERARVDSSGNLRFNSGYGSVATAYGVRAWINLDGQATTVGTGRGSANMDAVTDNGTGDYTLNFTNNMPDVNYGVLLTAERDATNYLAGAYVQSRAVGSVDIYSALVNDTSLLAGWDITGVHAAIVR